MLPPPDSFKPAAEPAQPAAEMSSEGEVQAAAPAAKRGRNGPQQSPPPTSSELQDKADRCRARNREHARQTRRRKKEFVENLQVRRPGGHRRGAFETRGTVLGTWIAAPPRGRDAAIPRARRG